MKILFAVLLLVCAAVSEAQSFSRYIIRFRNKATTPYTIASPTAYLSQKAIDRRTRYGIAIDSTDLPVTPRYLDSVRLSGTVTILNVSRWLNQVSIQTTDAAALAKIAAFPFVESAAPIAARIAGGRAGTQQTGKQKKAITTAAARPAADVFQYGSSYPQVHLHNGEFLHNIGLRGEGMIISMMDGGFFRYTTLRAFDSVNANGQVLGTYDFVARETSVVEDDTHGMQCFSVIAANIPSQFVGTAPKANFYLFRTEDGASEYRIEEHNWVCGAERADSAGGDLISSSLGYSDDMSDPSFNYTYAQMDGNTTIAARGADLAAKKGLLVVNSAGNQGTSSFKYIATPADGDSVLAVGAVNTSGQVASFSSYGPSADGQVKPDVASVGVATVVQTASNTIGTNNGTSFSAPNIAGLATCLWQGFRELNNMQIIRALRLSGSQAAAPDNRVGYGIPDMKKAVLLLLKETATASISLGSPCRYTIAWTSKDVQTMQYEIERRGAGETAFKKIGVQQGSGTVFSTRSYQFTDSVLNLSPGTVAYRIRQLIDTAAAQFSADYIDTVSIAYNLACNVTSTQPLPISSEEIRLLPNPAGQQLTLEITSPRPMQGLTFRILAADGRVVKTIQGNKPAGKASFEFSLTNLSAGNYHLAIYQASQQIAVRSFLKL